MKEIRFTNWWACKKKEQSISNTLAQLDLYNKTEYSKNKLIDPELLERAAKFAHDNQLVYFVTIFENEIPYCYLEIDNGFYRVNFLDENIRLYMSYDFRDDFSSGEPNKLFLSNVTFWDFEGNTDKVLKITSHIFKPNGTFHITERDRITNEQIDSEAKNKIDVSQNWEEYPKFGDYDLLTRKERKATIN